MATSAVSGPSRGADPSSTRAERYFTALFAISINTYVMGSFSVLRIFVVPLYLRFQNDRGQIAQPLLSAVNSPSDFATSGPQIYTYEIAFVFLVQLALAYFVSAVYALLMFRTHVRVRVWMFAAFCAWILAYTLTCIPVLSLRGFAGILWSFGAFGPGVLLCAAAGSLDRVVRPSAKPGWWFSRLAPIAFGVAPALYAMSYPVQIALAESTALASGAGGSGGVLNASAAVEASLNALWTDVWLEEAVEFAFFVGVLSTLYLAAQAAPVDAAAETNAAPPQTTQNAKQRAECSRCFLQYLLLLAHLVAVFSYYAVSMLPLVVFTTTLSLPSSSSAGAPDAVTVQKESVMLTWISGLATALGYLVPFFLVDIAPNVAYWLCHESIANQTTTTTKHGSKTYVRVASSSGSASSAGINSGKSDALSHPAPEHSRLLVYGVALVLGATSMLICVLLWPAAFSTEYRIVQFFFVFGSGLVAAHLKPMLREMTDDPIHSWSSGDVHFALNLLKSLGTTLNALIVAIFGFHADTMKLYSTVMCAVLLGTLAMMSLLERCIHACVAYNA